VIPIKELRKIVRKTDTELILEVLRKHKGMALSPREISLKLGREEERHKFTVLLNQMNKRGLIKKQRVGRNVFYYLE